MSNGAPAARVGVCPRHVRKQQSAGWRSELEVSMPCSECLTDQTASAIASVKPAARASPNLLRQGVSCASHAIGTDLPALGSHMERHRQREGTSVGRFAGAFAPTVVVDQPTRNQKVESDFWPRRKDICLSLRGLGEPFLILIMQ